MQTPFNFSWSLSPFDTKILRFKTGKITFFKEGDINRFESISDLANDLRKNHIVYATFRINANNYLLAQELEKNDFILVDGIISLEKALDNTNIYSFPNIRQANLKDLNQLARIGSTIFRGVSRYYRDSFISNKKADEIYTIWIENSLKKISADDVLVWEQDKKILGFITLQKEGQIPLIGVIKEANGKGIGKALLNTACDKFNKRKLQKVTIETQMTNIPALGLYQSSGFKIVNSFLTFRWHANI